MHVTAEVGTPRHGWAVAWPAERLGVSAFFLVLGFVFASWVGHIPGVQARLGLSEGELGIALFFLAAGSPVGMALSTRLVRRFGAPRTSIAGGVGTSVGLPLLLAAPTYDLLCAALFAMGLCNGVLNIGVNSCAVAVERAKQRPMMSSFHGFFSLGGLAGASLTAVALRLGAPPLGHVALVSTACIATLAVAVRAISHLSGPAEAPRSGPRRWNARLALLGALLFCCVMTEGAMADWTAVFLVGAGATPAVGALGYAAYSMAMAGCRFTGDHLVRQTGDRAVLIGSALLAAVGQAIATASGAPWASILGFTAVGLGLANVVPLLFRSAAKTPGMEEQVALALASGIGFFGFLVGPPLIGAIASATGLRTALALLIVPLVALFLAAGRVSSR